MKNRELKYLEDLNAVIQHNVGFQLKWMSIQHLYDYLAKVKRAGRKEFITSAQGRTVKIPIDFALKYTKPVEIPKEMEPETADMFTGKSFGIAKDSVT